MRDWQEQAACAGKGDEAFPSSKHDAAKFVRACCDRCPVRIECAEAGAREQWGVWGGVLHGRTYEFEPHVRTSANLCRSGRHDMNDPSNQQPVQRLQKDGTRVTRIYCAECRRENQRDYKKRKRT